MSTKKTRDAISMLNTIAGGSGIMRQVIQDAMKEVEAIERAAKAYQRPMAADRTEWLEMVKTMSSIAKDAP